MRATVGRDLGVSWSGEASGCGYRLVLRLTLRSFSEFFPTASLDRLFLPLVVRRAKVSLERLLSHVECHNQDLDRRSRYRPVVLYACRCFFWDLFSFLPRYGAALSVSRGGERRI